MSSRVWLGVLLGSCVWLGPSGLQAQQPKVVVMDFAGSGGDAARKQVLRGLRDEVRFEARTDAKRVLASEGVKVSSVAGRATVARELGLDYVIWGRVRGRGSSARAQIRIAGPQGKQIAEREAGPPGQSKGNARIQKAARAVLAKAVQVASPKRRSSAVQAIELDDIEISLADDAEAPTTRKAAVTPKPVATAEPKAKEASKTKAERKAKAAPAATAEPKKKKRNKQAKGEAGLRMGPEAAAPIFSILGGAGGRVRNVSIEVDDGAGGSATRKYESGVYLDIVFRLELRPLARNERQGLRGLVLEADGDFGLGLDTRTPGSTAALGTKAWRVLGQVGYFHALGKSELGGLLGIGFDALDLEDNGTMPSIRYLFLRIGPAFRHFFIERLLYLRVDAGFRWPFSYGHLEDAFGDASGLGFDAGLTLGGELDVGFAYLLRVSADYFKSRFDAFPAGTVPGHPAAAQGKDGSDLGINFHVMVGWSF